MTALDTNSPEFEQATALLATLPVEQVAILARRHCSRSALRRRRLSERDDAIRRLAGLDDHASGRAAALAVSIELGRYASSAWRFERGRQPPAHPRRRLLHRILAMNGGHAPSEPQVRRILAGVGVAQ
ncbi:MAG: hypothetical protein WB760_06275 [Xanthobacteraceae bacterium]